MFCAWIMLYGLMLDSLPICHSHQCSLIILKNYIFNFLPSKITHIVIGIFLKYQGTIGRYKFLQNKGDSEVHQSTLKLKVFPHPENGHFYLKPIFLSF